MRKYLFLLLAMCLVACGKQGTSALDNGDEAEMEQQARYEYGIPVDSFYVAEGVVQSGETMGALLTRLGAPAAQVNQLGLVPTDAFDARKFRAGCAWMACYSQPDSMLRYFVYKKDMIETVVFDFQDSLHVEKQIKEIRHESRFAAAGIRSSLWNAMINVGCPAELAVELSDVYQWTVDFFSLQVGDSVRLYYDEHFVDSVSVGIGRIYAASLWHGGKWIDAFYYENLDGKTPVKGYFSAEGENLRKAFLKAPLNYKRISSTFTYHRKHPIYGIVRPHTGVDYAAPQGTPVVTIGDGTVIEKGYKGGGGNTVKIRHNATYTTAYLHLSKYANGLAVGKHVSQGELIGYVGSTGASTGPHLDFRVWKNGTPVDPLHMDAPPAEPVPASLMPDFKHLVDSLSAFIR